MFKETRILPVEEAIAIPQPANVSAFSIGQIAFALGINAQSVRRSFIGIQPDTHLVRSGNRCDGFELESIPAPLLRRLEKITTAKRFRSVEHLLTTPDQIWKPEVLLANQPAEAVTEAHQLQRALKDALTRRNDLSLAATDLERLAAGDYKREFGKEISPRQIRRLLERTIERDGGREEFERLEIYLPDFREFLGPLRSGVSLAVLDLAIREIGSVGDLSPADRASLWRAAIEQHKILIEEGKPERKAKRLIFDLLLERVPGLAESREALRKQFERKLEAYSLSGVSALCDQRKIKSGRRKVEVFKADIELLAAVARQLGGGISQAFRHLYQGFQKPNGEWTQFSEAFRRAYVFNARESKSEVPSRIRAIVRPLLAATEAIYHGPKAAKLAAPSIQRNWDDVEAGAYFQSDDETSNVYCWFENEHGAYEFDGMRFDVLRPQVLPMVDVRTDNPLSFLVLPSRNYDSRAIRSLVYKTCIDPTIGLPHEGFYFERAIWESKNVRALVEWTSLDEAFQRHGLSLRLRNATTPRAKTIERIFAVEQNMMQMLPGYAGRNERLDGFERVQKFLASLKRVGQPRKGEVDPRSQLISLTEYADHLQSVFERFAAEPQNGKRLRGLSPREAWQQFHSNRPHQVLPDSLKFLLSTEETTAQVNGNGIRLRVGKQERFYYDSEKLGLLIGEKVKVRFNPELPDHITVTHPKSDPNGLKPFAVGIAPNVPAMSASKEDLKAANDVRRRFVDPQKAVYRSMQQKFNVLVRREDMGSEALRAAGAAHAGIEREQIEVSNRSKTADRKAKKLASEAGFDPAKIRRPEQAAVELEEFQRLRSELSNRENQMGK